MKHTLYFILALLVFASCGGNKAKKTEKQELKIEIPQVPSMISDPGQAALYLSQHFWDKMDFADTTYIAKEVTEQAFADYMALSLSIPPAEAVKGMSAMMDKARANQDVYNYFAERAEHYLYDPNSPYRNEDLYIAVLENIVSWDALDEIYKLRPQTQLDLARKNRVGERAADLEITLSSGRKIKLYDIEADYTLLYFINPDCSACAQATGELNHSDIVRELIDSGELRVVTVYPDEDLAAWNKHLGDLPGDWTNGYDAGLTIREEDTYDLRAIPSLYLLDKDKFVLLKDIPSGVLIHNYLLQKLYM